MLSVLAQLAMLSVLLVAIAGAAVDVASRLLVTALGFIVPLVFLYFVFRLLVPRRPSPQVRHGLGFGSVLAIGRLFAGMRGGRPARSVSVTTFRGERDGRLRSYEFTSALPPVIAHGDVVRVVGVPIAGRVTILAMRAPTGTVLRQGLLARLASGVILMVLVGALL